jgi:hypothetical protein
MTTRPAPAANARRIDATTWEAQLRGVQRRAPDDGRRAGGMEAALRVALLAVDEVERHRRAARLQVGGVAGVGDDAVDRVRELGGDLGDEPPGRAGGAAMD